MNTCRCLCVATHLTKGVCDGDAPQTMMHLGEGERAPARSILACQPCAEAALAVHPRVNGFTVCPPLEESLA